MSTYRDNWVLIGRYFSNLNEVDSWNLEDFWTTITQSFKRYSAFDFPWILLSLRVREDLRGSMLWVMMRMRPLPPDPPWRSSLPASALLLHPQREQTSPKSSGPNVRKRCIYQLTIPLSLSVCLSVCLSLSPPSPSLSLSLVWCIL